MLESSGSCIITDIKSGIWIAGTMQTLDARHLELFLNEGYKDGSWEYNLIGSHKLQKDTKAACGAIFDLKNLKASSSSGILNLKSWSEEPDDSQPKAVIVPHAVAVHTRFQENEGILVKYHAMKPGTDGDNVSIRISYQLRFRDNDPIPEQRKERKRWTPEDDKLLISAWLNTSKDPITANEQRMGTFWERISNYIALHCKASGLGTREPTHCKQNWHKLHSEVNKFCGSYEAATRGKSSGQSEDDVLKVAHELFFSDYKSKFNLDHAWRLLRYDQKWLTLCSTKTDGPSKRRKCDDRSQPEASHSFTNAEEQATQRPGGVKAAKNRRKKKAEEGNGVVDFEKLESAFVMRERSSKMAMLESLLAKKETLSEIDETIKQKLASELFM
ncbi:unnamed protein product [Microthlaspi erraticum]|uniref:Myb-like domain-containing protein n=1 Tax=Microthlaspi erraticum TaxID=1685480 RepID=A0A6D2IG60_9BRAS|nr:unnamed protein product [Microthlaspi erraticum]